MKLSIQRSEDFVFKLMSHQPDNWQEISKKIIKHLIDSFDLKEEDDSCNCKLFDFLSEEQCKDLSVMVFGNDFPTTVELVKSLRIVGDGQCPNCGSNDCNYEDSYPDGEFEDDEESTFTSGGYTMCNTCQITF